MYFQIIPSGRELVIDSKNNITSLQLACACDPPGFERYLDAKRVSHQPLQYSLEDFVDLIMLHGYLKNKGIKHKFLELNKNVGHKLIYSPHRFENCLALNSLMWL